MSSNAWKYVPNAASSSSYTTEGEWQYVPVDQRATNAALPSQTDIGEATQWVSNTINFAYGAVEDVLVRSGVPAGELDALGKGVAKSAWFLDLISLSKKVHDFPSHWPRETFKLAVAVIVGKAVSAVTSSQLVGGGAGVATGKPGRNYQRLVRRTQPNRLRSRLGAI